MPHYLGDAGLEKRTSWVSCATFPLGWQRFIKRRDDLVECIADAQTAPVHAAIGYTGRCLTATIYKNVLTKKDVNQI